MEDLHLMDILLAEDNPRDVELILRAVRRRNIVNHIHLVEDGTEVLDFVLCRGAFEGQRSLRSSLIILLSLKLPKMAGLDVLKELRAHEGTRSIPVFILAPSQDDPGIEAAYVAGANGHIVRPLEAESLLEKTSAIGLGWALVDKPLRS